MYNASFLATTFSYEIFVYPRGDTLQESSIQNINLQELVKVINKQKLENQYNNLDYC